MNIENFNASEARRLSEKASTMQGEFARAETLKILAEIKEAAEKGEVSIIKTRLSPTPGIDELIAVRLRNLGYTVQFESNQRDYESWYVIKW